MIRKRDKRKERRKERTFGTFLKGEGMKGKK
jgi:hypothetical protein